MPHRLNPGERYIGQMGLLGRFGLRVPSPPVISIIGPGMRRSVRDHGLMVERYGASYDPGPSAGDDLKFALKWEPTDLCLLNACFKEIDPQEIVTLVTREPTGIFSRRAWFLYEHLTERRLPLDDLRQGNYTPALDPARHIVLPTKWSQRSQRHRVYDNLLGTFAFCPTVRRTPKLDALMATPVADEAAHLLKSCDPDLLARAVHYLYTKETRSSFQIEREAVDETKSERFVRALQEAKDFNPASKQDYITLQNMIVSDNRYWATGWRDIQNFIGETKGGYREVIHYICPKPGDAAVLMSGLNELYWRLSIFKRWIEVELGLDQLGKPKPGSNSQLAIDTIIIAALLSFGFVFIHPFEDGNGRIHRFLIHHVLARHDVTPQGAIFPISAAMIRNMAAYDAALESVSLPMLPFIDWRWKDGLVGGEIEVLNDTLDYYRFIDATAVAEYLYEKIIETVRKDLPEELSYLALYDRAYRAVDDRLDGVPQSKVALLVTLCLQNQGRLAKGKDRERLFPMLSDADIAAAEALIEEAMQAAAPETPA